MSQNKPLLFVLTVVLFLGVLWSYLFITASTQRTLDQRVHDVAAQLKCPVCQNESVADSPSTISQQMRGVIRQQLQAGRSEQQVVQYFEDSYGPQILLAPQWQGFSLLIWLVPIVLFLAGLGVLFLILRDWRQSAPVYEGVEEGKADAINRAPTKDDAEIVAYRERLEQELAAEDVLFKKSTSPVGARLIAPAVPLDSHRETGAINLAPTGDVSSEDGEGGR